MRSKDEPKTSKSDESTLITDSEKVMRQFKTSELVGRDSVREIVRTRGGTESNMTAESSVVEETEEPILPARSV